MIDANSGPVVRLLAIGVLGFFLVILVFSSVARVDSGHVGVLTLFGRVTGEVLPEGIHFINPFKANHELSIRTQEIKESASVPSSEGLVMNLDTSLIYHLNPEKAADVYQKIGPDYMNVLVEPNLRAAYPGGDRLALCKCALYAASAKWSQNRFTTSSPANSANAAF